MPLPLEGVRILDLSRLYPGPYASLMLSDMGAEVIKIEDPSGDGIRNFPPQADDGNSIMLHSLNRGKKSIVLNLKQDEDRKCFIFLLRDAHVLIESFRPQVLEKLLKLKQIEELFDINPNLIIARISAFGQNAPELLKNIPVQ
jgi:alpha-methylacyl-CoA racemase